MNVAGVAELKRGLSEYLAKVRGGEEVLVTDRGRPVARLVPAGAGAGGNGEEAERIGELERAGLVRAGDGSVPAELLPAGSPADPDAGVREALVDERRAGR